MIDNDTVVLALGDGAALGPAPAAAITVASVPCITQQCIGSKNEARTKLDRGIPPPPNVLWGKPAT